MNDANSPAVQAAIDAAVAQEKRFGEIESTQAMTRDSVARMERKQEEHHLEAMAEIKRINGSVANAIKVVDQVQTWQLQHQKGHETTDERVAKLWGASLDGRAIRGVLMQQWKAVATGATAMGGLVAAAKALGWM